MVVSSICLKLFNFRTSMGLLKYSNVAGMILEIGLILNVGLVLSASFILSID